MDVVSSPGLQAVGENLDALTNGHAESQPDAAPSPLEAKLPQATGPEALGKLAASIAHEVNQPLAAIVANCEACLRWLGRADPEIEEVRASVAAIIRDTLRSRDIIRGLCSLAVKADCRTEKLNLNNVIEEIVPMVEEEARRSRVALELHLVPGPLPVRGSQVQLQQVLINLVMNGIQAVSSLDGRPGELWIRSRRDGQHAVVMVRDNGPGLSPAGMDRLFNAFHTTKREGMGIGLWICRSIIEAHGGRIWATPNLDHGATFYLALPVAEPN